MNSGILILRGLGGYVTLRGQAEWTPRGIHFLRVYAYFHFLHKDNLSGVWEFFFAKNSQKAAKMAKKRQKRVDTKKQALKSLGVIFFGMQSIFLSSFFSFPFFN